MRLFLCLLVVVGLNVARAETTAQFEQVYSVAILPFDARGENVKSMGPVMSDMLFDELTADPHLLLVDTATARKAADEAELDRSNAVDLKEAGQVGLSCGAEVVVVGAIVETDEAIYLLAQIIGAENEKVIGLNVKGSTGDNLAVLAEALAQKIGDAINLGGAALLAGSIPVEQRATELSALLGTTARPALTLSVKEQHVGEASLEPVVEAELMSVFSQSGFGVTNNSPDGLTTGLVLEVMAVSELALQGPKAVSVRAWVEYKATDRASKGVIAHAREFAVATYANESAAATWALSKASALVERRIVEYLLKTN